MKTHPNAPASSQTVQGKGAGLRGTRGFGRTTRLFAGIARFGVLVAFVGALSMLFYSASSASALRSGARGRAVSVATAAESAPPAKLPAHKIVRQGETAPPRAAQTRSGLNLWAANASLFPLFLVQGPTGESVTTFASNCVTPQSSFNLGETVCVKVAGAPLGTAGAPARRLTWVAHNGSVVRAVNVTSDPQTDSFTIPSAATTVLGGVTIDNRGTWAVNTNTTSDGALHTTALFTVHDPNTLLADLLVNQGVSLAASEIGSVGSNGKFGVVVNNLGPDAAQTVTFTEPVPANTTFVSFTQTAGPTFSCTTPGVGGTGAVTCTIASLAKDAAASFEFVYQISSTTDGSITGTASVSSTTADLDNNDNTADASVVLPGGSPPTACAVSCPANITQDSDANQAGAAVTYQAPTGSDSSCGAISCDHPSGSFFPIGNTTVTCEAETGDSCSFMVTINDARPLVITLNGADPFGVECHTSFVDPGVTATSPDPNAQVLTTASGTVDANTPGNYTITYTATDGTHSATATRTVVVEDTTPPMITLAGANPMTVECHSTFTDPGASATDDCSGDLTSAITVSGSVDPNVPGTYTLTYMVQDPAGNTSTAQRAVDVVDTTPPTITLVGANPMTVECHATFTDPGASATDDCSGDLTSAITVSGSVNPNVAGSYTLTYTVNDGANPSTATRTVNVVDTTPPTITLVGANPMTVECHTSFTDPGATASDSCAGNLTSAIVVTGSVNPNAAGSYTLTYTVSDGANTRTATRTVNVVDTTPPSITAPANASYTCLSQVPAANPAQATASDSCAAPTVTVSETNNGGSGSAASPRVITRTFTATDTAGNSASASQTITVIDSTPPTITCVANITADFNPAVNGAVVTYATPVGTDNCSGATTTQLTGLPSGATFPLGTTTNTFKATDAAGQTATCSFKVTVALTSIVGLDSVSLSGAAFIDSYDSNGSYPATKSSLANVLSNGAITLEGSGKVFGNVRSTRAGVVMSGSTQVTGNATAGTTVARTGSATVGGTITNNALAPLMALPAVPTCGPPYSSNSGISGTYTYNPSTGDLSLTGVNIATLANGNYCFHNVTLGNSAQLKVNGPVVVKLTGTLSASGAASLTNMTAMPGNLRVLSSYSGSNGVTLSNSTNAHLVIYAPKTSVTISGAVPMFGTIAGKTITISNSGMLHYDIRLQAIWADMWSLILGP